MDFRQKISQYLNLFGCCALVLLNIPVGAQPVEHKCIVIVDNSGGMQGFVRQDLSSAYARFLSGMEARLGDADIRLGQLTLLTLDGGTSANRLSQYGSNRWLYTSTETPLQDIFKAIPNWMAKKGATLAFLITDNVMSVTDSGGFDLPRMRRAALDLVQSVSGMGVVGVKSKFKGKYYAEVPNHNHPVTFPSGNAPSNQSVRPFYVYIISKGDTHYFDTVFAGITDYAKKCLNSELSEEERHIKLLPVEDAQIKLNPDSIPEAITVTGFPGSFFVEKGKKKFDEKSGLSVKAAYIAQDPVPMGKGLLFVVSFKNGGDAAPLWLHSLVNVQPKVEWIQNVAKAEGKAGANINRELQAATYLTSMDTGNKLPELHFALFPIARECYGGNQLKFSIPYRIQYQVAHDKHLWWHQWSTENDTLEPYKTLYLDRILETLMVSAIEQHLSDFSEGNLEISFEGRKSATTFPWGWILWPMILVAVAAVGLVAWKIVRGGD